MAKIETRTIRLAATVAALSLLALAGRPVQADTAVVRQDATPIVSAPGVGGQVLTRVDSGFPLTVLGRQGDWLRVSSPDLRFGGALWVPAERVGDIVAAPDAAVLSGNASATVAAPQFRMVTTTGDGATSVSDGAQATVSTGSRGSVGSTTVSASSNSRGGTLSATGDATAAATAAAADNPVPSEGNPTPATGNGVQPVGSSTPAVGNTTPATGNTTPAVGNPTPATGNPTPAVGNSTPALGTPTPALGNPTSPVGNSTPAMGNTVASFGNSRTTTP